MIRLGLCSGACLTRSIKGVIATASAAKLDAVEWAADAHIGVDDLPTAEEAMMATLRAGLAIASYATLYRAGTADAGFFRFDALLRIASALQAPIMRIYAGDRLTIGDGSEPVEGRNLAALTVQLQRLGDRAANKGITLCVSMGRGSSFDRHESAARIVTSVSHDFVRLAWEDLPGASAGEAAAVLEGARRFIGLVVARSSGSDGKPHPIAENEAEWRERIRIIKSAETNSGLNSFLLLASARPDGPGGDESLAEDAATLRGLVAE